MKISCVWEHKGEDTILWPEGYPGAFARGASLSEALSKLPEDLKDWSAWTGQSAPEEAEPVIVAEIESGLDYNSLVKKKQEGKWKFSGKNLRQSQFENWILVKKSIGECAKMGRMIFVECAKKHLKKPKSIKQN